MDYNEFAEKIKTKYPQYKDMDNRELATRMVEKYPQYNDVTFDTPKQEKRGIDLTPSGLVKQGLATVAAPIRGAIYGEDFKTARETGLNNLENFKPLGGLYDTAFDIGVYSRLPMLRGASLPGKVGAFTGNAAIQGGLPGALESLKREGDLSGFGSGTGIAAGINAGINSIPYVGRGISRVVNNPNVQNAVTKGLEVLTSVPQKFSQRALESELAGNSILSGKFNPETAYRPIEQKLTKAKGMLPDAASFGNEYYNLGQKAVQGMENLEQKAGEDIVAALEPLSNKEVKNGGIQNAAKTIINSFGKGGVYNSALEESPQLVNYINNALNKEGLTLLDLHRIKEALYNKGYAADALKEGTTAKVARGVAEQINNYLRGVSPGYAKPNDVYSVVKDVTRGLDSQNTIGSKLKNIGSTNSALSGLDQRLKAVDNLLPQQNKFYKQAQDVVKNEDEVNNIINTIGKQYERNPRLLANRTDEAFEQALGDLQNRTGVNFMDDLNNVRAREALENLFPGQGGGSGSNQGFGNLMRTALIGGAPTAALITHNPLTLAGLAAISPKIMAKGTIKNLGRLNNLKNVNINDNVRRLLNPLVIRTAAPLLYGGISNDEEY